ERDDPVHALPPIVALAALHLRDVAYRAARSDQALRALARPDACLSEAVGRELANRAHLRRRRRVVAEESLAQAERAERQRVRPGHPATSERRQLEAAPADVD